ncbi:type 2 lanthipeptide synthetase LanM family protein [Bacillus cereus]|uniref:type 2 lanthipeptide synthetase LanM family protein n=1 Tax=Bacillus cereus group TaxID=86661 RepID=UPI002DD76521|nr:type 2 lanthipeptide synthetase LanM family protein [Bacillus cereus]MEC4698183.1 type 2 lanthipeptide synthetase LanM family protein [Bacillus anthracis]MCU5313884.1 type 2 lanthipeptide synthetase LanM family protein [Bacillus cereus]MCU5483507.1 type 2 lanthipeptide synthetase LanM family protein [Bacillus cereus]HDR4605535.1 type 2 lantipeptide synthetase LanM family protein [Bacillus cereus]
MIKNVNLKEAIKGLTVSERYDTLKNSGVNLNLNISALEEWRNRKNLLADEDFTEMLTVLEYDPVYFSHAINENIEEHIDIYKSKILGENWFIVLNDILDELDNQIEYKKEMNHSYLLRPFLLYAEKEMNKYIVNRKDPLPVEPQVIQQIMENLASKLFAVSVKSFVLELNISKLKDELAGETPDERFHSFIRLMGEKTRLVDFYNEYIVLSRILVNITILFVNNIIELFDRLQESKLDIVKNLGVQEEFKISNISIGEGDTHQQGRSVIVLTFVSGKKVVYKPKNLKVVSAYNSLIDWINDKNNILKMPSYNTLIYDDFVIEEFVEKRDCKSIEEVKKYYIRYGQILGIMYILNGNDFHMENLIASGEYPIIVDLETLLQNIINFKNKPSADLITTKKMLNLVNSTLLLPEKLLKGDITDEGIDMSALAGKEQHLERREYQLKNLFTDNMVFDLEKVKIEGANNIPKLNGENVDYSTYIDEIVVGFENICNIFIQYRDELLHSGILEEFKDVKVRHVLRNTVVYAKMLANTYHPDYLRDSLNREQVLENIWVHPFERKEFIKSEMEDILNNDIPIFFSYASSKDIIDSNGKLHKNVMEISGYERFITKLKELNPFLIEQQVSVINIKTGRYGDKKFERNYSVWDVATEKKDNQIDFLQEAMNIGDKILKHAIICDETKTISWLTINNHHDKNWGIGPISGEFYDGLAGISLFYHYLYKKSHNIEYKKIRDYAFNMAKVKALSLKYDSGLTGYASLLYTAHKIVQDEPRKQYKDVINEVFKYIDESKVVTAKYNWLHGTASIIHVLLNLYEDSRDMAYLTKCIQYGKYLVKQIKENKDTLAPGFSQGISSLIMVLVRLSKKCEVEEFLELALELMEMERNKVGNLSESNWQNGLVGIGLSRIKLKGLDSNLQVDHDIELVLDGVMNSLYSKDDTLSCGNSGTGELFLSLFEQTKKKEYLDMAKAICGKMIEESRISFEYQTKSLPGLELIGLYSGLAGIGYQFLRILDVEDIASIATLD